jgi:Fe-S-cluster containining protein
MSDLVQIQSADRSLLAGIASAMAEAARRSGDWLACRVGCIQCCISPFAITPLDAIRLRRGLAELAATDPGRATAVRVRSESYVAAIGAIYPGNPATGELFDEDCLPSSMDDLPCPALDPATGACDLYDARPITCRSFGPATRIGDDRLAVCELCYVGASDEQIAKCAVELDPDSLELKLVDELAAAGFKATTIVAYALVGTDTSQ